MSLNPDESSLISPQRRGFKDKKLIVSGILVVLMLTGIGANHLWAVQSAKSDFAADCTKIFGEISANFGDYKDTSAKPNFNYGGTPIPQVGITTVRNDLYRYENLTERTSKYSGAKKSTAVVEKLMKSIGDFSKLKELQLKIESENPHTSTLRIYMQVYEENIYRTLVDSGYSKRAMNLILQIEKKFEAYNKANFPDNLEQNQLEAAKVVSSDLVELAGLCRGAR